MLRHLGLIAVCACIVVSVGCEGGKLTAPDPNTTAPTPPPPPSSEPNTMVTVEFGGRVVNADAGGPVESVRVSLGGAGFSGPSPAGWSTPKDTATSSGDGTFTLPLNLPSFWTSVYFKLTGKRMALGLAIPESPYILGPDPDLSVRRLIAPPGGVPYVIGDHSTGTATLTARR